MWCKQAEVKSGFPMEILYEDNHIIAVNKRFSEIVQEDITGDVSLNKKVKQYIKEKYNKPGDVYLGIVHRLDRPVSGVLLFARTSKASSRLSELFRRGEVRKTYWAIVKKPPPTTQGELMHYLVKNQKQNKSYCHDKQVSGSKKAILYYKQLTQSTNYYLLEVHLKTGRHHQIRAQLAKIGCPIKGDLKYGFARTNHYTGIALHARSIEFVHPVQNKPLYMEAHPPKEEKLWEVFKNQ